MAKKNETAVPSDAVIEQQPEAGGSYTRCPDSGVITLVERTSHEAVASDAIINIDSQESQA